MNRADFNTQPNGFPLESDATLGFMQSNYNDALAGLAKAIGGADVILTGIEISEGIATDGWIYYEGELLFFQGGAVGDFFIIEETVTAKANENGDVIDRYFVRRARFGTGAGQRAFSFLARISSLLSTIATLNMISNAGDGFKTDFVLLNGFGTLGTGVNGGTFIWAGQLYNAPPYQATQVTETNPIYLTNRGEWVTSPQADSLKFEPRTNKHLDTIARKVQSKIGEVRWIVTNDFESSQFQNGIGRWEYDGWRIANGANGTADLSGVNANLTAIQRVD